MTDYSEGSPVDDHEGEEKVGNVWFKKRTTGIGRESGLSAWGKAAKDVMNALSDLALPPNTIRHNEKRPPADETPED